MSTDDLKPVVPGRGALRGTRFLLAAAFVALVLVLGVVVAAGGGGGKHPAAAPPASALGTGQGTQLPLGPSDDPDSPASPGAGCRVAGSGGGVPRAAPAGVGWVLFGGVALPVSALDGPGAVAGGVARCYAHTPLGALLAAAQISVRYLLAGDWRQVLAAQVAPGAGASAYASERAQVTGGAGSGFGQYAGFQFAAYSDAQAVIELASHFPNNTYQVVTVTVVWAGGDWRLVLQPDGGISPNSEVVPGLAGLITWSGV